MNYRENSSASINQCKFPRLASPYCQALEKAVCFVLERFDPSGIIAAGTIIRGNPNQSSNLDIFVINNRDERQRLQRFFNTVPTEIFANPTHCIEEHFGNEIQDGRPYTAHMLATGFVVPLLHAEAERILDSLPHPTEMRLTQLRYGIADCYENATDMIESNPTTAIILTSEAMHKALEYRFWQADRWLPRYKALFPELEEPEPDLAQLGHWFYRELSLQERFRIAEEIIDRTISVRGFFE